MRIFFKIILYSILFLFLASCNTDKKKEINTSLFNNDLYIVDIDAASSEEVSLVSEYFKTPKTIILENSESALIGGVHGFQTTDEYLFILDNTYSKTLFLFDKNGKFIRKIGQIGHGPGEYLGISDFTIDTLRKEVYLLDSENRRVSKYDYSTGKFLNTILLSEDDNVSISHIQFLNDKIYTDAIIYEKAPGDKYMLQSFDSKTGIPLKKWLNPEDYNINWNLIMTKMESFFYSRYTDTPKYFQMSMDTVLMIKDDAVIPYLVVKDKEWLTKEKMEYLKKQSLEKYNIPYPNMSINGENISYDISNYFEFDDIICFKYRNKSRYRYVIYDKNTRSTRYLNYIKNNYLFKDPYPLTKIGCADKNGIYEIMDGNSLGGFIEVTKNGYLNPKFDKYEELINLDIDSNPVLFYYERK